MIYYKGLKMQLQALGNQTNVVAHEGSTLFVNFIKVLIIRRLSHTPSTTNINESFTS